MNLDERVSRLWGTAVGGQFGERKEEYVLCVHFLWQEVFANGRLLPLDALIGCGSI